MPRTGSDRAGKPSWVHRNTSRLHATTTSRMPPTSAVSGNVSNVSNRVEDAARTSCDAHGSGIGVQYFQISFVDVEPPFRLVGYLFDDSEALEIPEYSCNGGLRRAARS